MENNNNKLIEFLGKFAIGFMANAVLTPPVAVFLSSYTYGTAKSIEYMVENHL